MSAQEIPETDGYQPGGGFQSLIGNGAHTRDVIRTTLIVGSLMGFRELLGLYVGRQVALGIADLCVGAFLIGTGAWIILGPERFVQGRKGMRILSIVVIIAGSAIATLSIQSLFFAE